MIGVDLVVIARIEKLIERFGMKGVKRFLSDEEIALTKELNANTVAGFWAAKEACAKALGTGIGGVCQFHDLKLHKNELGAPQITLASHLIQQFSIEGISLSITHDGAYAIAVVAIEQKRTG